MLVLEGTSGAGDSLWSQPLLRKQSWKVIDFEGRKIWYTRGNNCYWMCEGDPLEVLPAGAKRRYVFLVRGNKSGIPDCLACTTHKVEGGRVAPECVHIRLADLIDQDCCESDLILS